MEGGKVLLDPTTDELKSAESKVCITYALDTKEIMHISVTGPLSKTLLKDVTSQFHY